MMDQFYSPLVRSRDRPIMTLKPIGVLLLLYTAQALAGICDLPEKKISFNALELPYYEGYSNIRNSSYKVYLSLCKPLSNLPPTVAPLCDKDAFSCITKIERNGELEYIRSAGTNSTGPGVEQQHLVTVLNRGEKCTTKTDDVSTRIYFFCNREFTGEDNQITYEGTAGPCEHQMFWHSTLACLDGERNHAAVASCVIKVPGYDAIIDLGVWASNEGYYTVQSDPVKGQDDKERTSFHLNLCRGIRKGPCANSSSVLCQVDQSGTKMIENLVNLTDKHTLDFNAETETINLKYGSGGRRVSILISCDRNAAEPVISLVHNDTQALVFRFLTVSACLVPAQQCVTRDGAGNIYDLSPLVPQEWEVGVSKEKQERYQIKVCGSLPISPENPCSGQTGICNFRFKENTTEMVDAKNLGIMSRRPVVNEAGDILLDYDHGSLYADDKGNSCNMSSELILKCASRDYGPRFESATACKHTLVWNTPLACPQKRVESHSCTVQETIFSNVFNLSELYNSTVDYHLDGEKSEYVLNVCGPLIASCHENQTCIGSKSSLAYMDGSLEMKFTTPTCPTDPTQEMTTRILFTCNHDVKIGSPELVSEGDGCSLELEWATTHACPPHRVVECSIPTAEGIVDLSPLSLPHQNYQVESDSGDVFVLNLCRSLVHSNQSRCSYQSAACLINSDEVLDLNIGELSNGIKLNSDGIPHITYILGSLCKDDKSSLTHYQTTIEFLCDPEVYDSAPVFMELSGCHYIFQWTHAAACPVQTAMGNCSVTSPESGFTFDLSSLNRGEGWSWNDSSRHYPWHLDINICAPLNISFDNNDTQCGHGTGVCHNSKRNFGLANSNLTFTDGQLMLVYPGGECPTANEEHRAAETTIKFMCPPRRMFSSGNAERDGVKALRVAKSQKSCHIFIDFYTDLACGHQVYCDVMSGDSILPLTKLRRHDSNYKVIDNNSQYYINICGPLVATDVPMSACNPQGVCGYYKGAFVGMGKVLSPPRLVKNGHVELRYEDGDICSESGRTWSSVIYFTCNRTVDHGTTLGSPKLVSLDEENCTAIFHMQTILACNDISKEVDIVQPDSCKVYHPGLEKYIDLKPLVTDTTYKVYDQRLATHDEFYEIQPCGSLVPSCSGSVCKVTEVGNFSLGTMNDVKYDPRTEELRVRYIEGSLCNSVSGKKFSSKIYYRCDPSVQGPGYPTLAKEGVLDCMVLFNWRTSVICEPHEIDTYFKYHPDEKNSKKVVDVSVPDLSPRIDSDVVGGSSVGSVILVMFLIGVLVGVVVVYRSQGARERVTRSLQEFRARMPVVLGGRSREDSTLLVSGYSSSGGGGFLADDDDYN